MALMASIGTGIDYDVEGLMLEKMGLEGMNVGQFMHFVETSERK